MIHGYHIISQLQEKALVLLIICIGDIVSYSIQWIKVCYEIVWICQKIRLIYIMKWV